MQKTRGREAIERLEVPERFDDGPKIAVGAGGWEANTYVGIHVDGTYCKATANHTAVIGVSRDSLATGKYGYLKDRGLVQVLADCPLAAREDVKVGSGGRATKFSIAPIALDVVCTGKVGSFTQPAAGGVLKIRQAADVEADRGRGITVVGADGNGDVIFETIYLDAEDSNTIVAGTVEFTTVAGVFTDDGGVLGAQNVNILRADGATLIVALTAAASQVGAEVPNASQEACCRLLTHTNAVNGADVTYVTWFGYDDTNTLTGERVQLAGGGAAAAAVATSTKRFKKLLRICTGEFTNAAEAATATIPDTPDLRTGRNTAAVLAEGALATIFIKPNA